MFNQKRIFVAEYSHEIQPIGLDSPNGLAKPRSIEAFKCFLHDLIISLLKDKVVVAAWSWGRCLAFSSSE